MIEHSPSALPRFYHTVADLERAADAPITAVVSAIVQPSPVPHMLEIQ